LLDNNIQVSKIRIAFPLFIKSNILYPSTFLGAIMGRSFQKDTDRMPLEGFLIPDGGIFLFIAEVLHSFGP
jgi:hypothetical protein